MSILESEESLRQHPTCTFSSKRRLSTVASTVYADADAHPGSMHESTAGSCLMGWLV